MAKMRPIRLGVIFDQAVRGGGGYQQSLNAALIALRLPKELVEVLYFTTISEQSAALAIHGIHADPIALSGFDKARSFFRRKCNSPTLLKFIKKIEHYSPFERILVDNRIDLVYFLSPSSLALDLENLNFITTVWDLCHRVDPEFPEVHFNCEFRARDERFRQILPLSTAILADSYAGKVSISNIYGIPASRIYVMPFLPSQFIHVHAKSDVNFGMNIRGKYHLDCAYVYYPASFWPHKNHVYLLEGLRALERNYALRVGAIFSGADHGNQDYIRAYARDLDLLDRIRFIDFVSEAEVVSLYLQSLALVMPTYFGPTNLPPLEAFQLGVPVLYSDKEGLRDQVGDAALLMDLRDPNSMALHLRSLIEDTGLRKRLADAGSERLKCFNSFGSVQVLSSIIEGFCWRRLCWP